MILLSNVKPPKDIYVHFLQVFAVWVEVLSLLEHHAERLLRTDNASISVNNDGKAYACIPPLSLSHLCPVCFGGDADTAFLCFDGNFQVKTIGSDLINDRDHRDSRIFVDEIPEQIVNNKVPPHSKLKQSERLNRQRKLIVRILRLPQIPKFPNTIVIQVWFLSPVAMTFLSVFTTSAEAERDLHSPIFS